MFRCNFVNYGRNPVCLRCDCKRPGEAATDGVKCWFNEIPEADNASDFSSAAVDEVFPEIMPLRKGENRFVLSTRKTPLERRLANSENEKSIGGYRMFEGHTSQSPDTNKALNSSIRQSLDQILGHSYPVSGIDNHCNANEKNVEIDSSASFPMSHPSKYRENVRQTDSKNKDKEQVEKSEKWFQRVAELNEVKDLPSAISDVDFPEIMPTRKGENRFVVSKKKDRSLTSPAYKRQAAMEHARDSKFVPFVPFPPGYFARKDTPAPEELNSSRSPLTETSSSSLKAENISENLNDAGHWFPGNNAVQDAESQARSSGDWNSKFSEDQGTGLGGSSSQSSYTSLAKRSEIQSCTYSSKQNTFKSMNLTGVSPQLPSQDIRTGWTGKSLEGSAVKEPDPLDVSEEAKTERWFQRVAQIKDISELSQIPDEDFPSIMPQRKGVNRFVVSKRKTPLERRLTSPKFKRNLPTVNTIKKDDDTE